MRYKLLEPCLRLKCNSTCVQSITKLASTNFMPFSRLKLDPVIAFLAVYIYLQVNGKSLQPHKVWLVARISEKGLSH